MNIGNKISNARKKQNLTQEQLADIMGVTRQSVSRWESDLAYPEMDKIVQLSKILDISCDYLLKDDVNSENHDVNNKKEYLVIPISKHYEYISKKKLFGLPLVHINLGLGLYKAKGIIAIGNVSQGIVSIGLLSIGIFSFGALALGVISLAVFALGIISLASIAVGIIAIGAIAVGLYTIGAVSIGYFSFGALSIAKYVAIGDNANGMIAIGKSAANGSIYATTGQYNKEEVRQLIDSNIPGFWRVFINWIKNRL